MKLKKLFNIVNRIASGYVLVITIILMTSILEITILTKNNINGNKILNIDTPLLLSLKDFNSLISETKKLTNSWIYNPTQSEKEALKEIHTKTYPALKSGALSIVAQLDNEQEQNIIKTFISNFDSVIAIQQTIIGNLRSDEDYGDDNKVDVVIDLFDEQLIPKSNNLLLQLADLSEQKSKSLRAMLVMQNDDNNMLSLLLKIMILFVVTTAFVIFYLTKRVMTKPINKLKENTIALGRGEIIETLKKRDSLFDGYNTDEIGQMAEAVISLSNSLKKTSVFSLEIGKGNFTHQFEPLSEKDILGNSLITMRDNLKVANEIEEKRKSEDEKRNWATEGMAIFGEILRSTNDDLKKLSEQIINKLVKYINANQGSIFIISNNETNEKILELFSCYAWDRKKYANKRISLGEGLVGQAWQEGETILMTDIPDDYIRITSGLGDANPSHLIIVPLKVNDEIFGVIELASLKTIEPYQKEFLEKLGESIASTISSVKINLKTVELLTTSQQQTGILLQQEEEMRQNLDELHATQDEMTKREAEISGIVNAIDNTIAKAELQMNGTIINLNEKFNTVFEIEKANLTNQNIKRFIYENQFDIFDDSFEIVSTGISSDFTIKGRTSKNNDKWLLCSLTPVLDSNKQIDKVLLMATDITQQKNLEDELAQKDELQKQKIERLIHENNQKLEELNATQEKAIKREAELTAIINGINQSLGTYELDINAKVTTVNQKFLEQAGLEESAFVGKSIVTFMPKDKQKVMYDLIAKLFKGEKHSGGHHFIINNEEKWFFETYTPVLSLEGKYTKILVLSNEITKSVIAERKMKEQAEELVSTEEELKQNIEEMHSI